MPKSFFIRTFQLLCCIALAICIAPTSRAQASSSQTSNSQTSSQQTNSPQTNNPAPASSSDSSPERPTIAPPGEIKNPSTANTDPGAEAMGEAPGVVYPFKSGSLPAEKSSPLRIPRFDSAPVIDGNLDDAVWRAGIVLRDFYQTNPGDNTRPSKRTRVLMGYDAKNLYIAFEAEDEPDKIRATLAKRDAVWGEDNVRLYLDTFNDQRRAYVISFNPLGIQADGILTEGRGTDFSVDLVMESKGAIHANGYIIEARIPFKSLRYEAGRGKLWGIQVQRNIDRLNDEMNSWMPISRDDPSFLSQTGRLTGLEGIDTERTIEIIPSLTLAQRGRRVPSFAPPALLDPGRTVNSPLDLDPGVTAKFGITPTVTLDFTYNPDFAQVEADEIVVTANQRFPIFFPEKRPFFLEGIDVFQTRMNVVNTRAIVDPDYAAKLTGKRGRNTFGILVASDNAPGNLNEDERTALANCLERRRTNPDPNAQLISCRNERIVDDNAMIGVLRFKRDIGRASNIGAFATSYNVTDRRNQTAGIDGRFRVNEQDVVEFQVTGTTSRRFFFDPDRARDLYRTGNGFGYSYMYDRTGRNFGFVVSGIGRTSDYRADVGFTPRRNTNQHRGAVRFSDEPDAKRRIISRRLTSDNIISHDWQGRLQNWQHNAELDLALQRQSAIEIGYELGYERLFEEEFGARRGATRSGAFFGADSERSTYYRTLYGVFDTAPSKKYSGYVAVIGVWNAFDFDFGAGPRFPRVSPAALADPACGAGDCDVALDPGPGTNLRIESGLRYQPTEALSATLDYTKSRLVRDDTGRTAFDDNIFSLRSTYQFTRFTFARARVDYSTLDTRVRANMLLGWTPNPGTSFYVGYNDDLNRNGFNPFSAQPILEPGFRRNAREFFIKMSYLFRRSF